MTSAATLTETVTIPQLGPWEASFHGDTLIAACKAYAEAARSDIDEWCFPEMLMCLSASMMRLTPRLKSHLNIAVPPAAPVSLEPFDAVDLRVVAGQLLAATEYVWTLGGSVICVRWDDSAPSEVTLRSLSSSRDGIESQPAEMSIRCQPIHGVHGLSLLSYNAKTDEWEDGPSD